MTARKGAQPFSCSPGSLRLDMMPLESPKLKVDAASSNQKPASAMDSMRRSSPSGLILTLCLRTPEPGPEIQTQEILYRTSGALVAASAPGFLKWGSFRRVGYEGTYVGGAGVRAHIMACGACVATEAAWFLFSGKHHICSHISFPSEDTVTKPNNPPTSHEPEAPLQTPITASLGQRRVACLQGIQG